VRKDMKIVSGNLKGSDVAEVTQAIEEDIINSLKDMIDALKKAQQDQKNKKPPPPPPPGTPPPPPDPKLIDALAELKMVRAMQDRINSRTDVYTKQYTKQGKLETIPLPEQGTTPEEVKKLTEVRDQLKDLGVRQGELSKDANDIAKGKNEKR
jgi:hypothetical protein